MTANLGIFAIMPLGIMNNIRSRKKDTTKYHKKTPLSVISGKYFIAGLDITRKLTNATGYHYANVVEQLLDVIFKQLLQLLGWSKGLDRKIYFLVDSYWFKDSLYWFLKTDEDIDFYPNLLVILKTKAPQYIWSPSDVFVNAI